MTAPRRDHGVAQTAWTAVTSIADGKFTQYRTRVLQLPVMFRTSGLVASLAYLASKGGVHEILAKQVAEHVGPAIGLAGTATPQTLIGALTAGTPGVQRRAEEAARTYADWLKRSVESLKYQKAASAKTGGADA